MRALPKQARQIFFEACVRQLRSRGLHCVRDPLSRLRHGQIDLGNRGVRVSNESSACSVS